MTPAATMDGAMPDVPRRSLLAKYLDCGVSRRDLGILPLVFVLPFMYVPKILQGDTQPWVLLAALIALSTFRTDVLIRKDDFPLFGLSFLCVAVYALRSRIDLGLVREIYTQVVFLILWVVGGRERGDYFPAAIKLTAVIWFIVGVYQWAFVQLGLPVEFAGRFVEGRGGIPSLTPEASYYGSLSMLQMMYLMSDRGSKNMPFVILAGASVLLSGSLLAVLLLVFPLIKLGWRAGIVALLVIAVLSLAAYAFGLGGVSDRLARLSIQQSAFDFFLDPSLNLRVGHIYFTLYDHVWESLSFGSSIDFMNQYNLFARRNGLFIDTGSNFILPAAGELIYSSGLFGAMLIWVVIRKAQATASSTFVKIEKAALIAACLLNPISFANPFLVMYAQKDT